MQFDVFLADAAHTARMVLIGGLQVRFADTRRLRLALRLLRCSLAVVLFASSEYNPLRV